jgi:DNA-binding MarR family transcriptional regulator
MDHNGPMPTVAEFARDVMRFYPRIFFACHTRHVRDPQSQRLLSRHQASVLDHLDEVDPMTLNDLARHMGVTAGTMSLTIDRLERKGYVVRLRDVADRRRVHLRLTSAGVRVRDASSVLDPPRVESLVAHLADEEREAAIHGLGLLARAADGLMAEGARGAGDERGDRGDRGAGGAQRAKGA